MSEYLKQTRIECPHCGHHLFIELDLTEGDQEYFEECPNCCNGIHIKMHLDDLNHKLQVSVVSDDEQYY